MATVLNSFNIPGEGNIDRLSQASTNGINIQLFWSAASAGAKPEPAVHHKSKLEQTPSLHNQGLDASLEQLIKGYKVIKSKNYLKIQELYDLVVEASTFELSSESEFDGED